MNRKYLIGKHTNQPRYREKINHRCDEGQHQPSQNHPPIRQFRIPLFHLTPYPLIIFPIQNGGLVAMRAASTASCMRPAKLLQKRLQIGLANVA